MVHVVLHCRYCTTQETEGEPYFDSRDRATQSIAGMQFMALNGHETVR